MIEAFGLTPGELTFAVIVAFCAGMVRGFSGFALSAMIMAVLVLILPPLELLAICWCLEVAAS
ncbi:MAG: sulfite exporter TauE/SafE family protein, partial [Pseudomonadota bacterium]